jgi:hypothetical protein
MIDMTASKKTLIWGIIIAACPTLLAAMTALVNASPKTECDSETFASLNKHRFQAIRTVAQPWRGPHHVYGIFSIPDQFRRDRLYTAKLEIQGFTEEFPETSPEAGPVDGWQGQAGHYMMRVNLPTRIALWFLLTGRFGDLKTPCHWWLLISDRIR